MRSITPQSITRFGRSADTKPIYGVNKYIRSIRPQSITRFGRSAGTKPIPGGNKYIRSIRPQSITRFGLSNVFMEGANILGLKDKNQWKDLDYQLAPNLHMEGTNISGL